MPGFANPLVLPLLLLPPLIALLSRLGLSKALRPAGGYRLSMDPWGDGPQEVRAGAFWIVLRLAARSAGALAFTCAVIAAAGPYSVERRSFYLERGADVIFALDVSPSMAALDLAPDRLGAAKALVRDYLEAGRPEAIGLVMFGREAALLAPPTSDHAEVSRRLDEARPGVLGDGTAVGLGLAVALRHVAAARGLVDRVVLITDGENNAGGVAPEDAAKLARTLGVELVIVGVGSRGEAEIVYQDPLSGKTLGGTYASGFDEGSLRSLAARASGEYFSAGDEAGLQRAFAWAAARSAGAGSRRTFERRQDESRLWILAFIAFAAAAWVLGRLANGGAE